MRSLVLLALVLSLPVPSWAQENEPPPATTAPADPNIDPTKLGVSLSRIQRGLRVAETKDQLTREGLRLEFNVQVFGQAPRIDVLQGIDLVNGAVPGTAPTHQQVIEFLTPQIYRSPVMPVSALIGWAANQLWQKSKRSQCEEEIAQYRAALMQGVNVSAPRCTQ